MRRTFWSLATNSRTSSAVRSAWSFSLASSIVALPSRMSCWVSRPSVHSATVMQSRAWRKFHGLPRSLPSLESCLNSDHNGLPVASARIDAKISARMKDCIWPTEAAATSTPVLSCLTSPQSSHLTSNAIDGDIGYFGKEIDTTGLDDSEDANVGNIKPQVGCFVFLMAPIRS